MNLKIVYFTILNYQQSSLELLSTIGNVVEVPDPTCMDDQLLSAVNVIFAPMGYFWGKKFFENCPQLKFIVSNTTGHPHIDIQEAQRAQIEVITLKNDNEFLDRITPTAEHTIGLMLSLLRGYQKAFQAPLSGSWNRRNHAGVAMISRMTVGIVGFGRLGRKVADICSAFDAAVQFYDPHIKEASPLFKKCKTLSELVSTSDVVTLHVPHEAATEGLISREILSQFKENAVLINTARGELIDEVALLEQLSNNKIAGAALDVLANEFDIGFEGVMHSNSLINFARENENLIISPHIGGSTIDAWSETEERVIRLLLQKKSSHRKECHYANSEILAFIPARGGSKSIKLKNLAILDNKPLVEYSLITALTHECISRTVCSSDHPDILKVAESVGAEVDKRPKELSGDFVSTLDVILDYLHRESTKSGYLPEYLLLLEPTSPFVSAEHINFLINALKADEAATSAQTVTKVQSNSHAFNQRYHDHGGSHFLLNRFRKGKFNKQLKPELFVHGNARLMRVKSVIENNCLFGCRSLPIEIDKVSAFDVDGADDLAVAEAIIQQRKRNI